ncbi:pancreatic progenitor cell [Lynx pardinus]|uniref:Pancreatic progenitor cell n=1 Tax=Lynx pardinus TaxID=191816 RepID=A0A485MPR9_LYNPA|nr:pancreatic progenitor cell [Lynx pardinus]
MTPRFVGSSPMSGFVLTAQNLEPALDSMSPSLSAKAPEESPPRFPPAHKQQCGNHPLHNRSAEYPGDAIPHHPGLPKANLGHWWAGFFFGKSTLLFMATVLESLKHLESPQASSGTVTCDLALEAMKKQPHGQPGKANTGPPS